MMIVTTMIIAITLLSYIVLKNPLVAGMAAKGRGVATSVVWRRNISGSVILGIIGTGSSIINLFAIYILLPPNLNRNMADITQLNSVKFAELRIIIDTAKLYGGYVSDIVLSLNAPAMHAFNAALEETEAVMAAANVLLKDVAAANSQHLLSIGYKLYDHYQHIRRATEEFSNMARNAEYSRMAMYNFSGSTLGIITDARNKLIDLCESYVKLDVDTNTAGLKWFMTGINVSANLPIVLMFLFESHHTNGFIVELVRRAVKIATGVNRDKLMQIIEHEKNALFGATRVKFPYSGIQKLMVRCGLVPVTASMNMVTLLDVIADWSPKLITGGATKAATKSRRQKTKEPPVVIHHEAPTSVTIKVAPENKCQDDAAQCLQKLAEDNKICVVLIDKTSPGPVEFNINGLISDEYVDKYGLRTGPAICIDERVLKRFNTVSELSAPTLAAPKDVMIWRPESPNAIVFETLNGSLFRVMGTNLTEIIIPRSAIKPLIEGVNTRLLKYHRLHEAEILANCFDVKAAEIASAYEANDVQFPAESAQNMIADRLGVLFRERIMASPPRSTREFRELVDKEHIAPILTSVFLSYIADVRDPEYVVSYVVKFEDLIRLFVKEYEIGVRSAKVNDLTFRERSPRDLAQFLGDLFADIVKAALKELDRAKKFVDLEQSYKEFYMQRKMI